MHKFLKSAWKKNISFTILRTSIYKTFSLSISLELGPFYKWQNGWGISFVPLLMCKLSRKAYPFSYIGCREVSLSCFGFSWITFLLTLNQTIHTEMKCSDWPNLNCTLIAGARGRIIWRWDSRQKVKSEKILRCHFLRNGYQCFVMIKQTNKKYKLNYNKITEIVHYKV